MKYISVNKLSDFEFHDAEFTLESFDDDRLIVEARFVNIHQTAEENPHGTDMEIACAHITFTKFNLLSYKPGAAWKRDENGNCCAAEPQIVLTGDAGYARLSEQLKAGIEIFDLGIKEQNIYFIDAISKDPFFTVFFSFDDVIIEWDEYRKEAWYSSGK